jgi:hypothetical protein
LDYSYLRVLHCGTEKDPGLFLSSLGVTLLLLGLVFIPGFLGSEREKRACERWVEQQRE